MPKTKNLATALATAVLLALAAAAPAAAAEPTPTRDVLYVGNNWDGTADVVDPYTFQKLAQINIIPDKEERLAEIRTNPERQGYFLAIRELVGEGHDQFVDDMFSSPDGRYLYVSRPSFADVIGLDLATRKIVWRTKIDGNRSDHMAISPDGSTVLVSASTAKKVHAIDTKTGKFVGEFPSGDQPHENNYSRDGKLVYHASIGSVFTPADDPALDGTKGERFFQIVDASNYKILKRIDMGGKLAEFGKPGMSAAVRPMALAPDEKTVYFQVSFFHGFVEYDLVADKVTRLAELPILGDGTKRREEYLLDSAHHGLSMSEDGKKLCVAGTMSDYTAIVQRDTFAHKIASNGRKPYWSTNSGDGRYCFVSYSGDDAVSVVSYAEEREVARIGVGDHPQRMRMGELGDGLLGTPAITPATTPAGGAGDPAAKPKRKPRLRVSVRPRRALAKRPLRLRVRVTVRRNGGSLPVRGARVSLAGVHARTDRRGRAVLRKRFGFDQARRYRVRASRAGYRSGSTRLLARRR